MRDKNGRELSTSQVIYKIINRFWSSLLELELFFLHLLSYIPSHVVRKIVYRLGGMKIGKGSTFHMGARFYDPRNIRIGKDTIIGEKTVLDGRGLLVIGNHVAIASDVMIYNSQHDINDPEFMPIIKDVEIEDYVFIGPHSIILPGVRIGRGAIVAAGAVVTKDVSSGTIVAGVPAQKIGERKLSEFRYRLGRPRLFR